MWFYLACYKVEFRRHHLHAPRSAISLDARKKSLLKKKQKKKTITASRQSNVLNISWPNSLQIESYCFFFHLLWTWNSIPRPHFLLCEEKFTTWSENHRKIIHPKSPTAPYKLSLLCLARRSACQPLAPKSLHSGRQRVSYGQRVKGVNYQDVGLHRKFSCAARQCHCKVLIWQWYHTLGVRLRTVAKAKLYLQKN